MSESKDTRVQNFLADLCDVAPENGAIVQACRKIVSGLCQEVDERMMYGGIMFSRGGEDFSGVFARKSHVSFEFGKGFAMNDPEKVLQGRGKFRRHLKLKSLRDVKTQNTEFFVEQAVKLLDQ